MCVFSFAFQGTYFDGDANDLYHVTDDGSEIRVTGADQGILLEFDSAVFGEVRVILISF